MRTIVAITTPKLLEPKVAKLGTSLLADISWLNKSLGIAQRKVAMIGDGAYYYPAVYAGGGETLPAYPLSEWGNYVWFDVPEPYEVTHSAPGRLLLEVKFGVVVFVNLHTAFPSEAGLGLEAAKEAVMLSLSYNCTVVNVTDNWEDVFPNYSLHQLELQYMDYPYGCFRVNCKFENISAPTC